MINYAAYVGVWNPLRLNETDRVSHHECGDTRKRLYFTRKAHGVLAYCHNCGESGLDKQNFYAPVHCIIPDTHNPIPMPGGCIDYNDENYPLHLIWNPFIYLAGTLWNPSECCFHIPITNKHGAYIGYNTRNVYSNPKYVLNVPKNFAGWMPYLATTNPKDVVVLVEDQISAARLSNLNYTAVCLFGANHSIEKVHEIVKLYESDDVRYTVWLDNDNGQIKEAAHILTQYITLLGHTAVKITTPKEPKNCTVDEIQGII